MSTYLASLEERLSAGLSRLPETMRARHRGYFERHQGSDGGWPGREGESDLYYTGFALRALAVLGGPTPEVAARCAGFLKTRMQSQASVVDFFSFLYSALLVQLHGGSDVLAGSPPDWPQRVAELLERFRTPDGGWNKVPGGTAGSTYHTFLVAMCHELLALPVPQPERVLAFVDGRRREDGGYVEVPQMRRSGTNPTAAGVGIRDILGQPLIGSERAATVDFLSGMAADEGGLRANERIPLADLLSTFTGCWTLARLEGLERVDLGKLRAFLAELEKPTGGFLAGLWDVETDVEYSFYGLGTAGLAAE